MSEWYDSQKIPSGDIQKLLQERLDKTNPRRTLTVEEQKRLAKLEAIAERLKRGENVHGFLQGIVDLFYVLIFRGDTV